MTQEEISIAKEKLKRVSCIEAAISAVKSNILGYEYLKKENEICFISTNSKAYKDFIKYTHLNNLTYDKDDRAPMYCSGDKKDKFFDILIEESQEFIKKQEDAIALI